MSNRATDHANEQQEQEEENSGYTNNGTDSTNQSEMDRSASLNQEETTDEQEASEESIGDGDENNTFQEQGSRQDEVVNNIKQLLSQHAKWQSYVAILEQETSVGSKGQGRPAILEAMYNNKEVVLHSLQAMPERNGQVGKVVDYIVKRDRFEVSVVHKNLEESRMSVRARNLRVIGQEEQDSQENESEMSNQEQLVQALFRPGMKFLGTIQIPGLSGAPGRKEYRLIVEASPFKDELGKSTGILARHRAYDDEQYVWIHVSNDGNDSDSTVCIHYADGETQCQGTWNASKGQFEGTVRQLLSTEDSIYHTRDEVTHTFTLSPTTASYPGGISSTLDSNEEVESPLLDNSRQDLMSAATKSLAEHRSKTNQLGFQIARQCQQVRSSTVLWRNNYERTDSDNEMLQQLVSRLMGEVKWSDLLKQECIAAEKACATFRRWADMLDSASFESAQERTEVLASLSEAGVTRAHAHAKSDECKETARGIFEALSTFSSFGLTPSPSLPTRVDMTRVVILCARLERNFSRFDGALRRAENRLTNADISQWTVSQENDGGDGDEAICTICHVELREDGGNNDDTAVLRLTCSHSFHGDCLRSWLRHHSQCPVCRMELQPAASS